LASRSLRRWIGRLSLSSRTARKYQQARHKNKNGDNLKSHDVLRPARAHEEPLLFVRACGLSTVGASIRLALAGRRLALKMGRSTA
jgi:hypothetical protein